MAIDRAARLRRNANRLAVLLRHEYGFDRRAAVLRRISRAIESAGSAAVALAPERIASFRRPRDTAAQFSAARCDVSFASLRETPPANLSSPPDIESLFRIERVIKLRAAIRRFAQRHRQCAQLLRRFSQQIQSVCVIRAEVIVRRFEIIIARSLRAELSRRRDAAAAL